MKHLLLILLLCSVVVSGQSTIDFETVGHDFVWALFANGPDQDSTDYSVVDNPSVSGMNTSSKVAKYVVHANADPWSGLFTDSFGPFTLTAENSMITVMVYKDVISNFNLKLEGFAGQHDNNVPNTLVNEWEKLTFDYSADIGKTVTRITIIPDFPSPRTAGSTNYWDNIEFVHPVVPVELTSFTAKAGAGVINLEWKTATETNNRGFEIEKSIDKTNFHVIGFAAGKGTSSEQQSYSFIDKSIKAGEEYFYRLKQLDFDGTFDYSKIIEVANNIPVEFSLSQNYPNPFNPTTAISFSLPVDAVVSLQVYNMIGQVVSTLADGNYPAGVHSVSFDASHMTSGMYIYNLKALTVDGKIMNSTRKMTLIK